MPKGVYERAQKICSIEGCSGKHKANGLCKYHYQQSWEPSESAKANQKIQRRVLKLAQVGWDPDRWKIFNYAQGGLCYLCGESNFSLGFGRNLDSDHNHDSGEPRGLLCSKCNMALNILEDRNTWALIGQYLGHI